MRGLPGLPDLLAVVAITVAVLLPTVIWGRLFADRGHVVPIVVAGVLGSVAAVAAVAYRLRWSGAFAGWAIGLFLGLAAWYNTAISDLPGDLVSSWKGLASSGLLIPTTAEFLVPPVVITAAMAWLAASLVLRATPNVYAVVPVGAATASALAYAVSLGDLPVWYVPVTVVLVATVLVGNELRRPAGVEFDGLDDPAARPRRFAPRQLAIAVGLVVSLGIGTAAFSSLFGTVDDDAFDLRARLVKPLDIYEAATPLASVKAGLIEDSPQTVFTVTLDGLTSDESVSLLPVATLDLYDGAIWTTSALFEPAGASLPQPEQAPVLSGREVRQTIELSDDYPFRFYPRAGTVRDLDGSNLAWDVRSGTVASVDPDATGYEAVIDLAPMRPDPVPDPGGADGALAYAAEGPDSTEAQFEILADYVNRVAASGTTTQDRLALVEANLRSADFGYNEEAPAGHSLAALTSYLAPASTTDDGPVGGRVGFAEQSASVFAVIARELGLPSRVVVGYRLETPITADAATVTVDESQIHAWPEIWVDGIGWVGYEPTNPDNRADDPASRTPAVSSSGDQVAGQDLADLQDPILLPDEDLGSGRSNWWWLLAVPALPVLYAGLMLVAKAFRRTRRRRVVDPDRRIIGAWLETRDRLRDLELPALSSSSALDLAEHLDVIDLREAADSLAQLAPVVDRALYAPVPSSADDADQAWALSKATVAGVRKSVGARQRLAGALDPSTFFRR